MAGAATPCPPNSKAGCADSLTTFRRNHREPSILRSRRGEDRYDTVTYPEQGVGGGGGKQSNSFSEVGSSLTCFRFAKLASRNNFGLTTSSFDIATGFPPIRLLTWLGERAGPRLRELAPELEEARRRYSRNLGPTLSPSPVHSFYIFSPSFDNSNG